MKVKIQPNQSIDLIPTDNATIAQAINDAMEFCKEYKCRYVNLTYNTYVLGIDNESDINMLIADYVYYLDHKKNSITS